MSIHGLIEEAKEHRFLFEIEPLRSSWAVIRRMVATPEVFELLNGNWENGEWAQWADSLDEWNDRCGALANEFDHFLNGGLITVALDPKTNDEDCNLKRLHPAENEIWAFRSRAPRPGIRVLGSFAETNLFVATNWHLREQLGAFGSREWSDAIYKSRTAWEICLGSAPRKSGQLHDYILRKAVSVDSTS